MFSRFKQLLQQALFSGPNQYHRILPGNQIIDFDWEADCDNPGNGDRESWVAEKKLAQTTQKIAREFRKS